MAESFSIKRGDTLPIIRGTLYEDEAKTTPVNLSNAERVMFIMAPTSDSGEYKFARQVNIIEGGSTGRWELQFLPEEVDTAATYRAELEVVWSDDPLMKQTYPKEGFITITVNPDLGDPS